MKDPCAHKLNLFKDSLKLGEKINIEGHQDKTILLYQIDIPICDAPKLR